MRTRPTRYLPGLALMATGGVWMAAAFPHEFLFPVFIMLAGVMLLFGPGRIASAQAGLQQAAQSEAVRKSRRRFDKACKIALWLVAAALGIACAGYAIFGAAEGLFAAIGLLAICVAVMFVSLSWFALRMALAKALAQANR